MKVTQSLLKKRQKSIIFMFLFFLALSLYGAFLRNFPVTVTQPDGEKLQLFVSGDEFYNWLHDKAGYTVICDKENGYYVYAVEKDGDLISSKLVVNRDDPKAFQLKKFALHSIDRRLEKRRERFDFFGKGATYEQISRAPTTGTINNICIFIRFSGEPEFTDLVSTYNNMFNDTTGGANSMVNYFDEVSYNQLTISTTFYPTPPATTVVSYQDSNPRGYYQPYNASTNPIGYLPSPSTQRRDREHTLLVNAVNAVSSQIPAGLNVDGDGDGYVDNVCFVVYGSPGAWNDLLWPHMWALYSQTVYINSKRVWDYNFQLQTSLASSGVGVLCHEMFHSLGAPDLYHYYYALSMQPVYKWDVMEWDLNPPQHMGAYMKYRYGSWISSIPTITTSGTYTLNPLTSVTNNCYRIDSPYSASEYFVVEYRRQTGTFESSLPGQGLLVYRINSNCDGLGNSLGPPDEVYIYRPNGTTTANGTPANANFNSTVGRTAINDSTNPSSFLSDGSAGRLDISNVGAAGSTISFDVNISSITVTSPNGGENWTCGSTQNITWTSSGVTGNVKITLWQGGGLVQTIASSTANDGSHPWTIAAPTGTGYTIKIREKGTSVADTSDGPFNINGTITVTSPNGGENWAKNSTQNITWTSTGVTGNVKITLWQGGILVKTIASSTANDGSHPWTIASPPGTDYTIKIREKGTSVADSSNGSFNITGITITSPNGGENWAHQSTQNITWTSTGVSGNVKITLWQSGVLVQTIASSTTNDGSHPWTIGAPAGTGYTIKIREKGTAVADTSDGPFNITGITVTSPNGGETWSNGNTENITWTSAGVSGNVKITLWQSGILVQTIASSTVNDGSHPWTIAAPAGTGYIIKIREKGTTVVDTSDAAFTLL